MLGEIMGIQEPEPRKDGLRCDLCGRPVGEDGQSTEGGAICKPCLDRLGRSKLPAAP